MAKYNSCSDSGNNVMMQMTYLECIKKLTFLFLLSQLELRLSRIYYIETRMAICCSLVVIRGTAFISKKV